LEVPPRAITNHNLATPARLTHVAITVPDLEAAEIYYRDLFAMDVITREAATSDGDAQLPLDKGWADARRAHVELYMVALRRGTFVLALFDESSPAVDRDATPFRPLFVGLLMSPDEIAKVQTAPGDDGGWRESGEFRDRYGIIWQLSPFDRFVGAGERAGKWLAV
jgi:catechol 2,3-dioxygenase-like lactoylglutathione lyase family enzyme